MTKQAFKMFFSTVDKVKFRPEIVEHFHIIIPQSYDEWKEFTYFFSLEYTWNL